MTEPPEAHDHEGSDALPPADGPLDEVLGDALEGILDLLEHGPDAADREAAACPALRDLAPELFTFFDHAVSGHLSPQQVGIEARAWQVLGLQRWPLGSLTAQDTLTAMNALAELEGPLPGAGPDDPDPPPENELERAVQAARGDPRQRRRVWEQLLTGTVHLAVVDYEVDPDRQASLAFLGSELRGTRHTFAFTSEGRLQSLLDDAGTHLLSVEATGEELARFWSPDTWLVLNPGSGLAFVLSPAEVKCLPVGPRALLPAVEDVDVLAIPADAVAEDRLAVAVATLAEVERIVVARVVLRATGSDLPTRVAAVRLRAGADPASVLPALDERCAAAGTGGWLALAEQPDDAFAAAVAAGGRRVFPGPVPSPGGTPCP